MKLVTDFKDYEILDMAFGEKLERWGDYLLVRPDPQIIWSDKSTNFWDDAHAKYTRSNTLAISPSTTKNSWPRTSPYDGEIYYQEFNLHTRKQVAVHQ